MYNGGDVGQKFGRYESIKEIASGGMATVYLGRALGAGGFERVVAIKAMHPHIANEPEFVAMFFDEARLAARVRHPNVVATLDMQEEPDGKLFLVMEYVEGPTLQAVRRAASKGPALPLAVTLRIILDILMGLHAAHEQTGPNGEPLHIVHRDVSPQNILVGVDGIVKITDFGVAFAESKLSSTRGGQVKGKLTYMSPEQIQSRPVDRRTDVYAAGVVFWELLAGRRLFTADNDGALVHAVLQGPTERPGGTKSTVPGPIGDVCMRALKTDPAKRYVSAMAFAESLENAAAASQTQIATSRAVAAYVKELGAHQKMVLPPVPIGGEETVDERASKKAKKESVPPSAQETLATDVAAVTSPDQGLPLAPSKRRLWPVVSIVALIVGGAMVFALGGFATTSRSEHAADGPASGAPSTLVVAPVSPSAEAVRQAPHDSASAPLPIASASSPAVAASADDEPHQGAPARSAESRKTSPPKPQPATKRTPAGRRSSAFRPDDL